MLYSAAKRYNSLSCQPQTQDEVVFFFPLSTTLYSSGKHRAVLGNTALLSAYQVLPIHLTVVVAVAMRVCAITRYRPSPCRQSDM